MRAVVMTKHGGPDVLEVQQRPDPPPPGEGEITVDAEIWGTASKAKHDAIRGFGVDHPIDYNVKGWHEDLPSFDVVLDPLGGSNWRISYGLLRPGGRTVNYGASNAMPDGRRSLPAFVKALAVMPRPNLIKQLWASKGVLGLSMPALWEDRGSYGPFLDPLVPLIEDGTIRPVIDATFPFEQAADAHRRLTERRNIGKVVLVASAGSRAAAPSASA